MTQVRHVAYQSTRLDEDNIFLKGTAYGHLRSGCQVRSMDPASKNIYDRTVGTVFESSIRNF